MKTRTGNLGALASVVQVAETGSFAAAARVLGLSSSAVSKSIARLERELGVKLFHRTTRSVSLTPDGERYVLGARSLIAEFDALTTEMTDSRREVRGHLRISAPAAYGRRVLAAQLVRFCERYPQVQIDLSLDDRHVDLAGERIDVVVRSGPLANHASLIAKRLFANPMLTCASPEYLHRFGEPRTPEELENHNCLGFQNADTGRITRFVFSGLTRRFEARRIAVNEIESLVRIAAAGGGIAQVPGYLAADDLASGRLREILVSFRPPDVVYSALYLDRQFVSPRIRSFVDFLSEYPLRNSGLV